MTDTLPILASDEWDVLIDALQAYADGAVRYEADDDDQATDLALASYTCADLAEEGFIYADDAS